MAGNPGDAIRLGRSAGQQGTGRKGRQAADEEDKAQPHEQDIHIPRDQVGQQRDPELRAGVLVRAVVYAQRREGGESNQGIDSQEAPLPKPGHQFRSPAGRGQQHV